MSELTQVWETTLGNLVPACAQCENDDCPTGRVGNRIIEGNNEALVDCSGFMAPFRTEATVTFVWLGQVGMAHFQADTRTMTAIHPRLGKVLVVDEDSDFGRMRELYDALNYEQVDLASNIVRETAQFHTFGDPTGADIPF